jgi:hypothetical protein
MVPAHSALTLMENLRLIIFYRKILFVFDFKCEILVISYATYIQYGRYRTVLTFLASRI